MKRLLLTAFALAFAVSCGSTQKTSGPSKLDTLFKGSAGNYKASGKYVRPMAWRVGQYIVVGSFEKGEKKSAMKMSIVGKADGGFIVEMATTQEESENVVQYLLKGMDKAMKSGDPKDIEFGWIKIRGEDGQIQTIEGPMIQMYKSMMPDTFSGMQLRVTAYTDGGTVVVPAGTFTGLNVVESETKAFGFTSKVKGYYPPSVPINGMVKSVSDDGKNESVLIGFGM
ncbi:MAG: hypothetical protein ACRCUT_14210, partial [Spirochaetota bacterium]